MKEKKYLESEENRNGFLSYFTDTLPFSEKRKMARLDLPVKVEYDSFVEGKEMEQEKICGITRDISQGGCLLLAKKEFPINSALKLALLLSDNPNDKLILSGKILRINRRENTLFEYGIAFFNIKRESRERFMDFCFKKMYEMVGLNDWPTAKKR